MLGKLYCLLLLASTPFTLGHIGDKCSNAKLHKTGSCQRTKSCTNGFTTVGDCPNDPNDVRCCIEEYPCSENNERGICLDKSFTGCSGKGFFPGYCPGPKNVQCCFHKDETDTFVGFLKQVHGVAVAYGKGSPNRLVMEWLRHIKYNGLLSGWRTLIGNVDDDWIDFANARGLAMMPTFADPAYCGQRVETDHWGATLNAIYLYPPPADPNINEGDFGGWGGDLATFWAEYKVSSYKNATQFCIDRLGKANVATTFKLLDFLEDADPYNIAVEMRAAPAKPIHDVVRKYYAPGGGYDRRFWAFYINRFAGDGDQGKLITRNMLVGGSRKINLLRTAAIEKTAGKIVPVPGSSNNAPGELEAFIDGFIAVLRKLTDDKGTKC